MSSSSSDMIAWYRSAVMTEAAINRIERLTNRLCLVTDLSERFVFAFERVCGDMMAPWPHQPPTPSDMQPSHSEGRIAWVEDEAQEWFRKYWCSGDAGYYERALLLSPSADVAGIEPDLCAALDVEPIHKRADAIDRVIEAVDWIGVNIGFDGEFWLLLFKDNWQSRCDWLVSECNRLNIVIWKPSIIDGDAFLMKCSSGGKRP